MELLLFDDKNSWVDIENNFKVKVDYCNVKQYIKLEQILQNYLEFEGDKEKKDEIFFEYAAYFIKYHIKDWQGVTDGKNEIKCRLVNDELEDSLWKAIITNPSIFSKLFTAIHTKIKFEGRDKKK